MENSRDNTGTSGADTTGGNSGASGTDTSGAGSQAPGADATGTPMPDATATAATKKTTTNYKSQLASLKLSETVMASRWYATDSAKLDSFLAKTKSEEISGSTYGLLCARVKKSQSNTQTITWNKVKGASGYVIYGNQCGKKYRFRKLASQSKTTYRHKKLKKGTYYKYTVYAYKKIGTKKIVIGVSKTIHSATAGGKFGNIASVKASPTSMALSAKQKKKITARQVKQKKKTVKKHRALCYESSAPSIAKVNGKGKVTAVKKGTCTIYVYAQNGISKQVKIKVKK